MHFIITPAIVALLCMQAQALPANNTLLDFVMPKFVYVPSDTNYQLCTQGCLPAALLCGDAPTVYISRIRDGNDSSRIRLQNEC
jgi:hypothetical protein